MRFIILMMLSLPLILQSLLPAVTAASSIDQVLPVNDYGIARPDHITVDEWQTALQLFANEMSRVANGSDGSLLHARHKALPSYAGVPCDTVNDHALQCVDTPAMTTTATEGRDCVFLHGSGEREDGPVTNTFPGYWGSIEKFTPQCKSRTFIHSNTLTRSWYNYTIMRQWCDVASGVKGGQVIKDKLIFTHSMGGLILAAAIYEQVCSIDHATTSWYQAGSPQLGSPAADWAIKVCADPGKFNDPIRWIAHYMGYCVSTTPGPANEAYLSMITTNPNITAQHVVPVFHNNIKGAMCGVNAVGLIAPTSIPMAALAALTCNKQPCDGMVLLKSCAPLGAAWGNTTKSDFYMTEVNHPDETCRNGDGTTGGDNRKPCSWFTHRV